MLGVVVPFLANRKAILNWVTRNFPEHAATTTAQLCKKSKGTRSVYVSRSIALRDMEIPLG